ncbi:hypothetical protein MTO96_032978 [Rhipicephalus appendiculatus]
MRLLLFVQAMFSSINGACSTAWASPLPVPSVASNVTANMGSGTIILDKPMLFSSTGGFTTSSTSPIKELPFTDCTIGHGASAANAPFTMRLLLFVQAMVSRSTEPVRRRGPRRYLFHQ